MALFRRMARYRSDRWMPARLREQAHNVRVRWAPSPIRRLIRSRLLWGALAILGLMVAISTVNTKVDELAAAQQAWGASVDVLVVTDDIAAGSPVAGLAKKVAVPSAMVPVSAVGSVGADAIAKVDLVEGEIVLAHRVTGGDGALPADTAAVTMPIVVRVPLVGEGDVVDLWSVDSANFSSRRVAASVVVLAINDDDVTVAVPSAQVADAAAASLRPVTMTLVG